MNKIIITIALNIALISCKGPGSGPLVKESFDNKEKSNAMTAQPHQQQPVISKVDVKVEPCTDCMTIAKLMSDKKELSGKSVTVKGQVTKVNVAIMDKNWIHIQDGTESDGAFDLTVTTSENIAVGEIVTFKGKITLDKDFGYGYFYAVLMEDGQLVK